MTLHLIESLDPWEQWLAAALECAERGWYVYPVYGVKLDGACACGDALCGHVGKHPIATVPVPGESYSHVFVQDGHKSAVVDTFKIKSIADRLRQLGILPNLGINLMKSGLFDLDIDLPDGSDNLAQLGHELGELPLTPTILTGMAYP